MGNVTEEPLQTYPYEGYRGPHILGRHTASQLTLHFALKVVSFAAQTKDLSTLFKYFMVPGGMLRGVT
jgi:hypothetical protein